MQAIYAPKVHQKGWLVAVTGVAKGGIVPVISGLQKTMSCCPGFGQVLRKIWIKWWLGFRWAGVCWGNMDAALGVGLWRIAAFLKWAAHLGWTNIFHQARGGLNV